MDAKLKEEIINLLNTIKTDAEMALDGRWEPSGDGLDGFETQISLIDVALAKLGATEKEN
jgi:hypothetical protein